MSEAAQTDRILTIPNVLSFLRIALIPVFVALIVDPDTTRAGLVLFVIVVATDWVDGALARATGQVSELGKILDPVADRLAIAAGLIALVIVDAFPLWAALLILIRDVAVLIAGLVLLSKRRTRIDVRPIGKVATFALMASIACIAWGNLGYALAPAALVIGWAFFAVGIVEYYVATVLYVGDLRRAWRGRRPPRRPERGRTVPRDVLRSSRTSRHGETAHRGAEEKQMEFPEDLRYTKEHEWVRDEGRAGSASASPTSRRTRSATSCTSTFPRRERR